MKRTSSYRKKGKALHFVPINAYETPALYRHMFQQDVQLMGHFSRPRRDERSVLRLDGKPEELTKAASLCASIGRDRRYRQEETILSAIENVVDHLAYHGTALFEIVEDLDNSTLSLSSFNPSYVLHLPFFYLQLVPRANWQDSKKFALIEKSVVWRVDVPHELGGASRFRRILKDLSTPSSLGPKFYEEDLKRRKLPKEFAFGDYRRTYQVHLFRVTKDWGWNGRDWSLDHITEYYQFYRHLTFKWAQAVVREHVVAEFNTLFRRLDISAQIILEGLSLPDDILKVRDQMQAGALDFAAATKAIR